MILKPGIRLCVLVLLMLLSRPAAAQVDESLSEREEVTAIDLVIELDSGDGTALEPPDDLEPADFVLDRDGQELAVVGLEGAADAEPWHVVVYFDAFLASTQSVRWAASALADRSSSLAELGAVEIVIADPEPRVLLKATRDAHLIDQTLSGVFLNSGGGHGVLLQREEYVLRRDESPELSELSALRELAEEERRLVVRQQDALSRALTEEIPGTSRRALVLVSDGFDPRPDSFYGASSEEASADDPLQAATEAWARTIAAYGWSVIVVVPPERERQKQYGVAPARDDKTLSVRLPGVVSRLDGSLNPEKAAAQHELGQRLIEQGDLAAAEEALREGLRFYHSNPKYARQRAAVLTDLGQVLLQLDRLEEARDALREAVALDPEREADLPILQARLSSPLEPLEVLAAQSAGRVVADGEALSAALAALGRRVRLTFQFRGLPDGGLHPIRVGIPERRLEARAARWVRFGTPSLVSATRARELLRGNVVTGELEIRCRFREEAASYASRKGTVEIVGEDTGTLEALTGRNVRATLGFATETGSFRIEQRRVVVEDDRIEIPVEVVRGELWFAVVVEDVSSGRWGGASADL